MHWCLIITMCLQRSCNTGHAVRDSGDLYMCVWLRCLLVLAIASRSPDCDEILIANIITPHISEGVVFLKWCLSALQRLFFLNGEQELSAFLLVDMGMVKYPKYECRRSRPVFATREDLLAYEEVIQMTLTQVAFLSFMAPVNSQLNTSLFVILNY